MTNAFTEGIADKIIAELEKAKSNVVIAVAWFTNPTIYKIIYKLFSNGIRIDLILADDQINFSSRHFSFQELIDIGINLRIAKFPKLMHHKFCIIDNNTVISGSYNWTLNAEYNNYENIIISTDENLVNQFITIFDDLITNTDQLSSVLNTTSETYSPETLEQERIYVMEKPNVYTNSEAIDEEVTDEEVINLFSEAKIQYQQTRHQEAIDVCSKINDINPNIADTYELIAASKWRQGKYQEQIEYAHKAISLDKNFHEAYNLLAIGYTSIRNAQLSIENYEICINHNPESYVYYKNRAESYIELESESSVPYNIRSQFSKKADEDLRKVVELTNKFEEREPSYSLYYSRGTALLYLGKRYEAKSNLSKAIEVYKSSDKYEQDRNILKDIKAALRNAEQLLKE